VICDLVKQQPQKWGEYKGREDSLVTRYHEGKRKLASFKAPIGLRKPPET
jgi:hypothetical protein